MLECLLLGLASVTVNAVGATVDGIIKAGEKIGEFGQIIIGKGLASEIAQKSKMNSLIISKKINIQYPSLNGIKRIFKDECTYLDYYKIVDKSGKLNYIGKLKYSKNFFKKNKIIELFNANSESLGYIEEITKKETGNDISVCSIYEDEKEVLAIKKYTDSSKIFINFDKEDFVIDYNKLNAYDIKYKDKQLGKLHITRQKKENEYEEKYVIEFTNKEDERFFTLLSLAIDMINN